MRAERALEHGLLLATLALLPATSGCNQIRKTKECNAVAHTVGAWIARQPTPSPASAEPARLAAESRQMAHNYDELDKALAALDVKSVELAPRVKRYRSIASQAARALRDVADALERDDAELARRRRVEFDESIRAEPPLVAEINAVCAR
jgi:hypothetical protein